MEKVCVRHEYQFKGEKKISERYEYQFTAEENDRLAIALEGYDAKRVGHVINDLEFYCQDAISIQDIQRRSESTRDRESALKTLKKATALLSDLYWMKGSGAFILERPRSLPDLRQEREAVLRGKVPISTYQKIFNLMRPTIHNLNLIIKSIEEQATGEEKAEPGRPGADALGVARTIADLLHEHLGVIPTTYPDGIFANVVRICFEALGLPSTDPSRAIQHAVKSFQTI